MCCWGWVGLSSESREDIRKLPEDAADVSKSCSSVSTEGADTWWRGATSVEPLLEPADAAKLLAVRQHGVGWVGAMQVAMVFGATQEL